MSRRSVDRPIVILGTGRSGTTLFYDFLAFHPELAWFSNYDERFSLPIGWGALNRVHDLPLLSRWLDRSSRYVPRPVETYRMLDRCTFGLFTENRDLGLEDVNDAVRARFTSQIQRQLRLQGKERFITKYTGVPRTAFMRELFPDVRFIHVYRDGRSVANSFMNVDWWPKDETGWWYGEMPAQARETYEASGRSPIVLAGLIWSTLVTSIDRELNAVPSEQVIRVRYDELIRDPVTTLRRATDFCELEWRDDFEQHVQSIRVNDRDTKWQRDLSPDDQVLLQDTIGATLRALGY